MIRLVIYQCFLVYTRCLLQAVIKRHFTRQLQLPYSLEMAYRWGGSSIWDNIPELHFPISSLSLGIFRPRWARNVAWFLLLLSLFKFG